MAKFNVSIVASAFIVGGLLFTGCGGGGGGGGGTTSGVTLTGKAVDELIVNGVVEAHAGSAGGNIVASGRTDDDGVYKLDADGYSGVVVVKVTCDANSSLYYPDTNTTTGCPANLKLYSATDVSGSGEVNVSVTPATQAMFAMATGGDENGSIDPDALENARNKIALAFGVDPVSTDPIENEGYKKVITAFHDAAEDANKSVLEVIDEFAEDAADGELGNDSNLTTLVAEKLAENNVTTPFVEAAENNETYTPPDNPAGLDEIAQAKQFFETLRTQGNSLTGEGKFFDTEAKGIEQAADNTVINADLASVVVGNIITLIGEAIDENATQNSALVVDTPTVDRNISVKKQSSDVWSYTIEDINGTDRTTRGGGTVTVPDANLSGPDFLTTFTTLQAKFDGTIPATKVYETTQAQQNFKADITFNKTPDGATMDIANVELSTADGTKLGISGFKTSVGYDVNTSNQDDPVTLHYVKLDSITLNGALDHNYSATGTLTVGYAKNQTLAANGGIVEVYTTTVDGRVGCKTNPNDVNSNDVGPYDNADFNVTLDNQTMTIHTDQNGEFHVEISGAYDYDDLLNATFDADPSVCAKYPGTSYPVPGIFHNEIDSKMKVGNDGYLPNQITFNGLIKNEQTTSELDGSFGAQWLNAKDMNLTDLDHVNDDPHVKITVSGTLKRPSYADMSLNITSEYDPDNNATPNAFTVNYIYDATTVMIDGKLDKDFKDGNVSFTAGTGLAMTVVLSGGDIDYNRTTPLTKDNKVIGELDDTTGVPRIKYIDGSFETLP